MNTIKSAMNKIKTIPAKPETPYPQVVSWLFSLCIMFMFIYVCEMTGMQLRGFRPDSLGLFNNRHTKALAEVSISLQRAISFEVLQIF